MVKNGDELASTQVKVDIFFFVTWGYIKLYKPNDKIETCLSFWYKTAFFKPVDRFYGVKHSFWGLNKLLSLLVAVSTWFLTHFIQIGTILQTILFCLLNA